MMQNWQQRLNNNPLHQGKPVQSMASIPSFQVL